MSPVCEHCGEFYTGNAYRVTSEEEGVVLLDMVVCHSCWLEARRLGLETQEIESSYAAFN